jgi:hypothetical protein
MRAPPSRCLAEHLVPTRATKVFEYDVSMDGKRFLVNTDNGPQVFAPLVLGELAGSAEEMTYLLR